MVQIYYEYLSSPVGQFLVAGTETSLHFTGFTTGYQQRPPKNDWRRDTAPLQYALPSFGAYFAGEPIEFDIPISPKGTAFQMAVWDALRDVTYGQTASYGDIAIKLGKPGASRAVGGANNKNHLPIIIPCHRIIGADGSMTSFGGGVEAKIKLLKLEGIETEPVQLSFF